MNATEQKVLTAIADLLIAKKPATKQAVAKKAKLSFYVVDRFYSHCFKNHK